MATAQETFNRIVTHLASMDHQSIWISPDKSTAAGCAYRAPDGNKCAVGCLIPDAEYTPELETNGVLSLLNSNNNFATIKTFREEYRDQKAILSKLQNVHDSSRNWNASDKDRTQIRLAIKSVAHSSDLDPSIIDTLTWVPLDTSKPVSS